jgi:hypothetical protein
MKGQVHRKMYFGFQKKSDDELFIASSMYSWEHRSLGLYTGGFWPFAKLNPSDLLTEAFEKPTFSPVNLCHT